MSLATRTPVDTDRFWIGLLVGGSLTMLIIVTALFVRYTFAVAGGAY